MDGLTWGIFVFAAFAGGFVSGFSGFAMGLVVSCAWLHIITPLQTAALIAGYRLWIWLDSIGPLQLISVFGLRSSGCAAISRRESH